MSLQKIPLILSVAILAVAGIVVTLVTAQSGTTINTTPHVISNVTVMNITQTSAKIHWQTEEPAGSSRVDFFINGSPVDMAVSFNEDTTMHNLTIVGLLPGTTYHYRVISEDTGRYFSPTAPPRTAISDSPDQVFTTLPSSSSSASSSSSSASSATTVPLAPTNVTGSVAEVNGFQNLTLSWSDNSTNETYFDIYRRFMPFSSDYAPSDNLGPWVKIGQVASNVTSFTDVRVPWMNKVEYRVHSCNANGCTLGGSVTVTICFTEAFLQSFRCLYDQIPTRSLDSKSGCTFMRCVAPVSQSSSSTAGPMTSSGASTASSPTTSPSLSISPSTPTPSVTAPTPISTISSSPTTLPVVPSIQPTAVPLVTAPKLSPNIPKAQTGSTVQKVVKKMTPRDFKKEQQAFRRDLRKFERVLLKQGKTAALDQVADLREELYEIDADDPSAGEALMSLQEEFAELRLIADSVPLTGQGTVLKSGSASSARIAVASPISSQPVVIPKVPAVPLFSKATSIVITYPPEGSTLRGFTHIDVALQNASEASGLQFQIDGVNSGGDENGKPPYGKLWFTKYVANGTHELRVMAWDAKGNIVTSNPVQVIVENVPDTAPPTMSGPAVTAVTRTTATIRWTTDEPVGTSINYKEDLGGGYGRNHSAINNYREKTKQHEVTLTGLTPGTKYSYYVSVADDAGNSATQKKMGRYYENFTTLSNSPLTIFNLRIEDVTQTSAVIAWTTSVPADAELKWSGSVPPVRQTTLTTEHSLTLTDLKPFTSYIFRIRSEDAVGNVVQVPSPGVDYRDTYFQTQEILDEVAEITTRVHRWKIDADGNFTEREDWSIKDYPGARSYFTVTVKDDRPLQAVKVSLQGKRKTYWEITLPQCSGKTSCEDRNHPFTIPEELGRYDVHFDVEEDSPYRPGTVGRRSYGASHALIVVPCPTAKCE